MRMRDAGADTAESARRASDTGAMAVSTFQKITVVACVVLCVALLLPKMLLSRGKRDANGEGPAGHFPPLARGPEEARGSSRSSRSQSSRAHNPEAIARARGPGAGKSSLAGQIIPIYGFGILLYILYILFKITSKGKTTKPPESRFSSTRSENTKRKITDFELLQLQERLNETKDMIERIISSAGAASHSPGVAVDEEQTLLLQLQEIARVMQEGRLVECVPDAPDPPAAPFCCVHDTHTHATAEDASGQSQPHTHTGSDISPERSGVRQRVRQ